MAIKKPKSDAKTLDRWKRTERLFERIAPAEKELINEICQARKKLGLNKVSRMDVIMLAITYATGSNSKLLDQ